MRLPDRTMAELRDARETFRDMRSRFNTNTTKCGACDVLHHENREEYLAAQQIDGILGRINKVLETVKEAARA